MDLLEYQAKQLFRQVEIPVLPSEIIAEPRAIKQLQIPYPLVLKSQVRVGSRGKAGGIEFVSNTIDAIAAARHIFNLSILGEYPQVILAEAKYESQQELFLSISLDYELQCPIIFGSSSGGMDINRLQEDLQQVVVTGEFSAYLARSLAVKMGLQGDLILAVSEIITKMYRLFESHNLELIEINPLAVNAEAQLMALDGKIKLSDRVIARYPDIRALLAAENNYQQLTASQIKTADHSNQVNPNNQKLTTIHWLNWQESKIKGKIAIIGSEENSALVCWDLIKQEQGKPAVGLVLDTDSWDTTLWKTTAGDMATKNISVAEQAELLAQELREVLTALQEQKITVVLFNLWLEENSLVRLGQLLDDWCQAASNNPSLGLVARDGSIPWSVLATPIEFVLRIADENLATYRERFPHPQIFWTNDLTEAIDLAISLSKTK